MFFDNDAIILQLKDETLMKLTMIIAHKLVSITTTTKFSMHKNIDRPICTRYKEKLGSTSDIVNE